MMNSNKRDGDTDKMVLEDNSEKSASSQSGMTVDKRKKRAIIVLGMHRSGTSALTRIINLAGAALPTNLLPELSGNNERGFWESRDIMDIHDELLESANSSWDDISGMPTFWFGSDIAAQFGRRLFGILERDFSESPLFVIKDPRICRFVPFWLSVLEEFETEPMFVITIRNPLEVAASLKQRDEFLPAKSLMLWLRHFLEAEFQTRGFKRSFTTFEAILQDWYGELLKIGENLDVRWSRLSHVANVEIEDFLSTRLRHHTANYREIKARPDIVSWVKQTYEWGIRAAESGHISPHPLDEIRLALEAADTAFGPLFAAKELELTKTCDEASKLSEDISTLQEKLMESENNLDSAQFRIEEYVGEIEGLTHELNILTGQISEKEAEKQNISEELQGIQSRLDEKEKELSEIGTRLNDQQVTIQRFSDEIELQREHLGDGERSLNELQTKLSEREDEIEGLTEKVRVSHEQLAERESNISRLSEEIERLVENLADKEGSIHEFQTLISEREGEIGRLSEEMDSLIEKLKEREEILNGFKELVAYREGEAKRLSGEIAELQGDIAELQGDITDREERIDSLTGEIESFLGQLTERESVIGGLQEQISNHLSDIDILSEKSENLEKQITQSNTEVNRLNVEVAGLNAGINERDRTIKKLMDDTVNLRDLVNGRTGKINYLKNEIEEIQTNLANRDACVKELTEVIANHKAEAARRDSENKALSIGQASYKHQLIEREKRIRGLSIHSDNLHKQSVIFKSQISRLSQDIKRVNRSFMGKLNLPFRLRSRYGIWMNKRLIKKSGLFEGKYYLENNPDVADNGIDPLTHFLRYGAVEGRNPHPLFDTVYYLDKNTDVLEEGCNPLVHYLRYGFAEGRDPHPLFQTSFYQDQNPDVAEAGMNPLTHYIKYGALEARDPNPYFKTGEYLECNPEVNPDEINPLVHYMRNSNNIIENVFNAPTDDEYSKMENPEAGFEEIESKRDISFNVDLNDIYSAYQKPENSTYYESEEIHNTINFDTKLIAFYFPQFHPFPENEKFWGKGFTEWTSTTKAPKLFEGHYQPRLPGELGFYDTRIKDVLKRQIELAKQHGIFGFCLHHYWFSGNRVMRVPFNHLMNDPDLDIPFCLHWANEPWTVRWDGYAEQGGVLLAQNHTPEDDIMFIKDIIPALKDKRYIKINGRPLLVVYRPSLFPDIKATIKRWRECCRAEGIGDLYLVMMQTAFEGPVDPRQYDFEAAIEYPPHNMHYVSVKHQVKLYDPNFKGNILSYPKMVEGALKRGSPEYKLFRGVMVDWDCTPRRSNPDIFLDGSPHQYQKWLEGAIRYTEKQFSPEERILFINAWNEWAEGAYLEPDRRFGYAYLNATSKAISSADNNQMKNETPEKKATILVVSHDANLGGAQVELKSLLSWLYRHTAIDIRILSLEGGIFLEDFRKYGKTITLNELALQVTDFNEIGEEILDFCDGIPNLIFCNTVSSGRIHKALSSIGAPVITYVHELEESIRIAASEFIDDVILYSSRFIACSPAVKVNLMKNHGVDEKKIDVVYDFIEINETDISHEDKLIARRKLGLPEDKVIVMGCGIGLFWRKGSDLFIETARRFNELGRKDVHFIWIGDFDKSQNHPKYGQWQTILDSLECDGLMAILGVRHNLQEYFRASDIFLLPSREDPFPLVCLNAAENGIPIICFENAGGMPDFVEDDAGFIVPFEDVTAVADRVEYLVDNPTQRSALGAQARNKLLARHTIDISAPFILECFRRCESLKPAVSVIIPNYNKEKYLRERLNSVFNQTFQDFEVIILDDASADESMDIINEYVARPNVTILRNDSNNGVFNQWKKGIELAKADLIWIAEADDSSKSTFLESLLPAFEDTKVKLSYSQSFAINNRSDILFNYGEMDYLLDLSKTKWGSQYTVWADQEVKEALAYRNTIPNVSAAVFRKFDIDAWYEIARDMKLAGDWLFYLFAIEGGKVSYTCELLNLHRRYDDTCSVRTEFSRSRFEEVSLVQLLACKMYNLGEDMKENLFHEARSLWKAINLYEDDFEKEYQKLVDRVFSNYETV